MAYVIDGTRALRVGDIVAVLSVREPNLVAWSIDDFTHNLRLFTPEMLADMLDEAREINPDFSFLPCCYYPVVNVPNVGAYKDILDGILFPYRHESDGANLTDSGSVETEVRKLKEVFGESFPIILDVYASAHSRLGSSTPGYVKEIMSSGWLYADGVHIYCHQYEDENPEKYQVIRELFHAWAKE